jgi:murein DD-endopeptidase MepM/ murein hydrolase activator NlpD
MEEKQYFVVVLAHSLHGRLRRIHIPHQAIYISLLVTAVSLLTVVGFLSSYVRMSWKVSNYNSLRQEVDALRTKYKELQKVTNEKNAQLATLEVFASEVSVAYGLKQQATAADDQVNTGLTPSFRESIDQYDFLRTASISSVYRNFPKQWQTNIRPSLWPIEGRLSSGFGGRSDPFSGEGAIHTGLDLTAPTGTPVRATADGIIKFAAWGGQYGMLVIIDHGNGMQTYYGHMSQLAVVPGQEVRRGETLGRSGSTGRSTGPHLHYEVRLGGTPVNPYPYLAHSPTTLEAKLAPDLPF